MRVPTPVRIGWESLKANAVPMIVLWTMAAALVGGYFLVPGVAAGLEPLRDWMERSVWEGAVASQVVFSGLLPWVFYAMVRSIRPRANALTCVLQVVWGCAFGVLCNWFFFFQDALFGPSDRFSIVAVKVLLDQFGWTVLLAPPSAVFCFWLGRDMSLSTCRRDWPDRFVRDLVLPNLVANWCVAIPANFAVYAFPPALRIVVCGLVGTFWTLLRRQVGARSMRQS